MPPQALPAKIHTLGCRIRGDDEILQELFGVLLRGVRFEVHFVIDLSGILRLDNNVAQIRYQMQPLSVAYRRASRQIGANPRPGAILPIGLGFLRSIRRSRNRNQKRGRQKSRTDPHCENPRRHTNLRRDSLPHSRNVQRSTHV